jgi:hypothetical protein
MNMQSIILRGDLGNVTKRKNLLGVHFCGLENRQLFAKLNQRCTLVFLISCRNIPCSGFWGPGFLMSRISLASPVDDEFIEYFSKARWKK